jgi:ATP-dependent DNA helicase RecG
MDDPLRSVVGPRTAAALDKGLGLRTVGDLLRHYPRRYAERGELTELDRLQVGEQVTVLARVEKATSRRMKARKGSLLEVVVTDGTARLSLTFFNQAWRERDLVVGRVGLFSGRVADYRGTRQLTHPDYQLLADDDTGIVTGRSEPSATDERMQASVADWSGALVPLYPATASLPTWRIAQCVSVVLDTLGDVPDPVPRAVRERRGLLTAADALRSVHRPRDRADVKAARSRLVYEEAFVLQAVLARRRLALRARSARARPRRPDGVRAAFELRLPFALTPGQRDIVALLDEELAREHPMHRLLQGEVGSGKTMVALLAMLTVVDAGGQAALLAPTEVLAQQHTRSLAALLGDLGHEGLLGGADTATRIGLLTGSLPAAARRRVLDDLATGAVGIAVGTHALLEDTVAFHDLGLVVIDEQHRFGVEQRAALVERNDPAPHVLVMTATPIPRTVAMTVFGDLETSTLRDLPPGRSGIASHVVPELERPRFLERTWERIAEEVAQGRQVYVVCPRIGGDRAPDDDVDGEALVADGDAHDDVVHVGERTAATRSVLDTVTMLRDGPLHGLRVEALHGRMPADDKDDVMSRFAAGGIDVLVATTVIEVGVDVANATVMVILDAERFGVSQLHQLRGRVGRGRHPGLCLLVTSAGEGTPARDRVEAVAATSDGFALARVDLEQRREGDVLGAAQSGRRSSLRLLSVLRDGEVIEQAREDASEIVAIDPGLAREPDLAGAVERAEADVASGYLDRG